MEIDEVMERAEKYLREGNYEEAVKYFTKALGLDSDYAKVYTGRGDAYSRLPGKNSKAIEDFTKALKLNSKYTRAYCKRGDVYYLQKEYVKAINDYTKALELNPKNIRIYNNRGLAYKKQRNTRKLQMTS